MVHLTQRQISLLLLSLHDRLDKLISFSLNEDQGLDLYFKDQIDDCKHMISYLSSLVDE